MGWRLNWKFVVVERVTHYLLEVKTVTCVLVVLLGHTKIQWEAMLAHHVRMKRNLYREATMSLTVIVNWGIVIGQWMDVRIHHVR